jgi:predicted component of type VI protein secretion system
MDAKLIVVGGEAQASEFPLNLPTIVGRSRAADVKLSHPLVSRKHCELFESDGQLIIRDLGSLNGTFVGESRISDATVLPPGATVTIGAVTFKAVYGKTNEHVNELPNIMAAAATSRATASPLERTIEINEAESPVTEAVQADDPNAGYDLGWLEEPAVEEAAEVEIVAEQPAEESTEDDELNLPEAMDAEQTNTTDDEVNEFAPPEQQPATGGDDDDLSDFFASLK